MTYKLSSPYSSNCLPAKETIKSTVRMLSRWQLVPILILFSLISLGCSQKNLAIHGAAPVSTSLQRMPTVKLPMAFSNNQEATSWTKKNKATIVHLWATWCSPCQTELLDLKSLWQKYGHAIDFLLIAVASEKEAVQSILKRHKLPFNSLLDSNAQLPAKLASPAMPLTLFVDRYGEILNVPDPKNLQQQVSRIEGARNWRSKEAAVTMEAVLEFEAKQP